MDADLRGKLARLEVLETEFEAALQREKIEALKELAYGAGHEINNPLANISVQAQTLLRDETDPERRRRLAAINSQAFRAHEMIADLMLFARPPEPAPEPTDMAALVDQVIEELAAEAAQRQTTITRTEDRQTAGEPAEYIAQVDPTQLAVALRALCTNSLEAIGQGGGIQIRVLRDDYQIILEVTDNGPGVSDQARRHLFDPFYSGREAGRGLGFGLSKCWRIVGQHSGTVQCLATTLPGAKFRIVLPSAVQPSEIGAS